MSLHVGEGGVLLEGDGPCRPLPCPPPKNLSSSPDVWTDVFWMTSAVGVLLSFVRFHSHLNPLTLTPPHPHHLSCSAVVDHEASSVDFSEPCRCCLSAVLANLLES